MEDNGFVAWHDPASSFNVGIAMRKWVALADDRYVPSGQGRELR
jgi:hypothetical protein